MEPDKLKAVRAAAGRLEDLDYHLTRWASPARLAAHLAGDAHDQGVPAAAEADLPRLRARHDGLHALEAARAQHALHAAEEAAAQVQEAS